MSNTLFTWQEYENDVFVGGNKKTKDYPSGSKHIEYMRNLRQLKKSLKSNGKRTSDICNSGHNSPLSNGSAKG